MKDLIQTTLITLGTSLSLSLSLSLLAAGAKSASSSVPELLIEDRVLHSISPLIFGQFLERPSWSGETGPESFVQSNGDLPESVMGMLYGLRPTLLRFPGGTDVEEMDWTDLIDNAPGRPDPKRPVSKGHQGDEVTNRFGYDEFFRLRNKLGFEILLVGNLKQALYRHLPLEEAARREAGLLAYATAEIGEALPAGMPDWGAVRAVNGRPEPVPVRYFMVGNETYFHWPPKDEKALEELGFADSDAAWPWFRECLLAYGRALKAVDPKVELIIDGFHDAHRPSNETQNAARRRLFSDPDIRELYSHLGAHHYAPMGFHRIQLQGKAVEPATLNDAELWYGLTAAPGLYNERGENVAFGSVYDEMIDLGYKVAVTEWNFNAWSTERVLEGRPLAIDTAAKLATAGFLHGILRHGDKVSLATQSMLMGTSWDIAAIRADESGVSDPKWQAQGQVARFYRHQTGTEFMASSLRNVPVFSHPAQLTFWFPALETLPLIDVVVTRNVRGLFLHAINRSLDEAMPLSVRLSTDLAHGRWTQQSLGATPKSENAQRSNIPVDAVLGNFQGGSFAVSLPAASISIIAVEIDP